MGILCGWNLFQIGFLIRFFGRKNRLKTRIENKIEITEIPFLTFSNIQHIKDTGKNLFYAFGVGLLRQLTLAFWVKRQGLFRELYAVFKIQVK
nr:MAG TPA: hypothetical protein [Caudoviricetes sp.]